jgi:hypothetical protein
MIIPLFSTQKYQSSIQLLWYCYGGCTPSIRVDLMVALHLSHSEALISVVMEQAKVFYSQAMPMRTYPIAFSIRALIYNCSLFTYFDFY